MSQHLIDDLFRQLWRTNPVLHRAVTEDWSGLTYAFKSMLKGQVVVTGTPDNFQLFAGKNTGEKLPGDVCIHVGKFSQKMVACAQLNLRIATEENWRWKVRGQSVGKMRTLEEKILREGVKSLSKNMSRTDQKKLHRIIEYLAPKRGC